MMARLMMPRWSALEDVTDRLLASLHRGELDVLLLALPRECGAVETVVLFEDPFVVGLPHSHPLAKEGGIKPQHLLGEDLLLLKDGHCLRDHALAALRRLAAKRLVAADLNQKNKELADLQLVLKAREDKLAEAQQAQAELIRKQRELDDAKREINLTVEKRVQAVLTTERDKAKLEAEEGLKLRLAEKEEQIASMQRQVEELKRQAEQRSERLQGEVKSSHSKRLCAPSSRATLSSPCQRGNSAATSSARDRPARSTLRCGNLNVP